MVLSVTTVTNTSSIISMTTKEYIHLVNTSRMWICSACNTQNGSKITPFKWKRAYTSTSHPLVLKHSTVFRGNFDSTTRAAIDDCSYQTSHITSFDLMNSTLANQGMMHQSSKMNAEHERGKIESESIIFSIFNHQWQSWCQ